METAGQSSLFRDQLLDRRERLELAITRSPSNGELQDLLETVDSALRRIEQGSFGICEVCHDPIESERLLADPLMRVCLDHLTPAQRRDLEHDLELATRVQRQLLPAPRQSIDGWEVAYHFEPAGPVSGDYCDLVPSTTDDSLYFFLGDISGKGVSASLLMTHVHAIFRSLISTPLPLGQLMEQANRLFCESTISSHYATLVAGKASRTGEVEFCSAGHVPILLARPDGVIQIEATGLPIGLFCESRYQTARVRLTAGQCVILCTDGVTETAGPSGVEYGLSSLTHLAAKNHQRSPAELLDLFREDIELFRNGAPRSDDATMMILRKSV